MDTTLTIRLPAAQRRALQRRAAAARQSESALVRDLIDRAMQQGFDFERVRHLAGSITRPPEGPTRDSWRTQIRDRNWRE